MDSITQRIAEDKLVSRRESGVEAAFQAMDKELAPHGLGIGELKEPTEKDIANHRALVEAKIAAYNSENQSALSALKTGLLINAGALITLLTFISRIWTQNSDISQILNSLLVFAFGVFSAGIGICCNYLMHRSINTNKSKFIGLIKFVLTCSLALALLAFLAGTVFVYSGLSGALKT